MRMAFCLDGELRRPGRGRGPAAGVDARADRPRPAGSALTDAGSPAARQVARVVSVDHDGEPSTRSARPTPSLRPRFTRSRPGSGPRCSTHRTRRRSGPSSAPGEPGRRASRCAGGWPRRTGTTFELAGVHGGGADPERAAQHRVASPGCPRTGSRGCTPIAEAAQRGKLDVERLRALPSGGGESGCPAAARHRPVLQRADRGPGARPSDVLSPEESRSREGIRQLYGLDHEPTDAEIAALAETWRPFRTWATVMIRAKS